MNLIILWGAAQLACLSAATPSATPPISLAPVELKCEYRVDPLGIDTPHPRLSWILRSDRRHQYQTAYEILVAGSARQLQANRGDLWDSGKVDADTTVNVSYSGNRLESDRQCFWKVRVWDGEGKPSGWSAAASWTMGLLSPNDWAGKWIGLDPDPDASLFASANWIWFPEGDPAKSAPLGKRHFRRVFDLPPGRLVRSASISITADNEYLLSVNGRNVGSGVNWMSPGGFDLTSLLKPGRNFLAVEANNVGDAPNPAGLIARLQVQFAHGTPLTVVTDASWKSSSRAGSDWDNPALDDSSWPNAKALGEYGIEPWGKVEDLNRRLPARYLRRTFAVEKPVRRATAHVCGLGFFNLYLNAKKVSSDVMDPALSEYSKAVYYVTFDVTKNLKLGDNALGVVLGNGRFFAPRLEVPIQTETFGFPKLLLQLNVEYSDGTKAQVVSDEHWRITAEGPIRSNNEYDGEEYDARLEMPGWDRPGFDDSKWKSARTVAAPAAQLVSQAIEPMRVTEVIHPIGITHPSPGAFVVDMGQNFYGTIQLRARGPKGAQIRMTGAYSLKPDGTLKTEDNRSALCTDVYTFKGQGLEVWSPAFRGQGFRRVQVTGFPGTPTLDSFDGLVIHTAAEPAGEFECSNDLVNRIHIAMRWGMRMFLRSAPLDPDRDERQAWNGDPAKDAESEAFNFGVAPFYTKWMDDVERSQRPDGTLPDVTMYWTGGAGVEWPSVFTIIPDWFIDFYADREVAATHYAAMKTWVLAMRRYELPDGTLQATSYGDWCDTSTIGGKAPDNGSTPRELVSSAYQYHNYRIMQRLANLVGRNDDEQNFAQLADKLKAAFNRVFLDSRTHTYRGGTQCGYILALKFGLVPDEQRAVVIANLADDVMVKHGGHLSVGLIGMQWLMQTLTDVGLPDVAWSIVTQTTRPSWGYMLSKGATTIWERWDYDTRDPGMNSEALLIQAGNLDAWFYQTLAGIRPASPGFKTIVIKSEPLGDLTWVKAGFDSIHGRIQSEWHRSAREFDLDVTIPPNTTATVYLPARSLDAVTESGKSLLNVVGFVPAKMQDDRAVIEIGSGAYRFVSIR